MANRKYEKLKQQKDIAISDIKNETAKLEGVSEEAKRVSEVSKNVSIILGDLDKQFEQATKLTKTDIYFLMVASALQVTKSLVFPYIAESFNKSERLAHNDKSIEQAHKQANKNFKKRFKKHGEGYWRIILRQPPAYDITRGSKDLGIDMGGAYHRMYTLGHDPILGWIFGTMNILTDVVTLNNFQSYRVARNPMRITGEYVLFGVMFQESYDLVEVDYLNLPAAIFAQAQHLQSDKYTKLGLPIPILSSINEDFARKFYRKRENNYNALCLERDLKAIGVSFAISKMFDMIISLVHGLFRTEDEDEKLYEVRTRKILLYSNSIASASTIVNACITSNPKNLDIGGLLNTVTHLFMDTKFIQQIKHEFLEKEFYNIVMGEEIL